jgi:uncharacterized protein YuzE
MKIQYYQETDSLYIELLAKASVDSNEVAPGVVADKDGEGHLVGIGVEHASKIVDLNRIEAAKCGRAI